MGQIDEPTSIQEALQSDHAREWKQAIDAEYKSLMEHGTWELIELPRGRRAINCEWIFHTKYDQHGNVERYKDWLVAKGFSQKSGVDYEETFSPVMRLTTLRVLLTWAACNRIITHQMDVTTAFLNGDLKEIFMQQPDGYIQPGKEHLVCRLKKSLYRLKQAPRCWNVKFTNHMKATGFHQSDAGPCVFVRTGQNEPCASSLHR